MSKENIIDLYFQKAECFRDVNYHTDIGEREQGTTEASTQQEMLAAKNKMTGNIPIELVKYGRNILREQLI